MATVFDQAPCAFKMTSAFLLLIVGAGLPYVQPIPTIDALNLKGNLGTQSISNGFVMDQDGTEFSLSELKPYTELFSSSATDQFSMASSGHGARDNDLDQQVNDSGSIPVYRGLFRDGKTIVQLQKDTNGNVVFVEIRNPSGKPDTFLVKTKECRDDELLVFGEDDLDSVLLDDFEYVDGISVQGDNSIDENSNDFGRESLRGSIARMDFPPFVYERGDGTSSECTYFKIVKVGIIFDSDFCRKFGSASEARGRIMMIIASASVYYEQDMCVKLRITDIHTPDSDCNGGKSVFSGFPREKACGRSSTGTFLKSFRDWMNKNRGSLGLDPDAIFHAFTGFQPRGTLGCAYVGVYCRHRHHSYGVDYMTSDSLQTQSVIFAHEVAHNLNAPHLSSNNNNDGRKYLMAPALQVRNDGFSQSSIDKILGHLDSTDVTCDETEMVAPSPTKPPTQSPSSTPTTMNPSNLPSLQPTLPFSSSSPSHIPTQAPVDPPDSIRDLPCQVQQVDRSPICVEESRQDGMYACYRPSDLINIRLTPSCNHNDNPFFLTMIPFLCEESRGSHRLSVDDDNSNDRKLRGKSSAGKKRSSDQEDRSISSGDTNEDLVENTWNSIDLAAVQSGTKIDMYADSNDNPPLASFDDHSCNIGCTIEGEFICFLANIADSDDNIEKKYRVTFSAIHSHGTNIFSRDVAIRRNHSNNNNYEDSNDSDKVGQPALSLCDHAVSKCNKL